MTKRFILDEYYGIGSIIIDTYNENVRFKHENELSMQQCCDLLNELSTKCSQLEKENEKLKKELNEIKRQEQEVCEYLQAYHEGKVENIKR